MNPSTEDRFDRNAGALAAEETLRMIATLPARAGLEDRVKAGLRSSARRGMVISWPFASADGWMHSTGMRSLAEAGESTHISGLRQCHLRWLNRSCRMGRVGSAQRVPCMFPRRWKGR